MQPHNRCRPITGYIVPALLVSAQSLADGAVVDKIYDPYVYAMERELEYRVIVQNDDKKALDNLQIHRLGLGKSWSDRVFSELYLIAVQTNENSFSVDAYELETKWQLTEQGQYWADFGMLFELEWIPGETWEYGTTVLISKEWGRWVSTMNAGLNYEWMNDVVSKWETSLSIQARYRLTRSFEPAMELYVGQDTTALGPVIVGNLRTGSRRKLHWEFGVIFGLDSISPNQTFRGLLEFEF